MQENGTNILIQSEPRHTTVSVLQSREPIKIYYPALPYIGKDGESGDTITAENITYEEAEQIWDGIN